MFCLYTFLTKYSWILIIQLLTQLFLLLTIIPRALMASDSEPFRARGIIVNNYKMKLTWPTFVYKRKTFHR